MLFLHHFLCSYCFLLTTVHLYILTTVRLSPVGPDIRNEHYVNEISGDSFHSDPNVGNFQGNRTQCACISRIASIPFRHFCCIPHALDDMVKAVEKRIYLTRHAQAEHK